MTSQYEIKMPRIVAQKSLYHMKHISEQMRKLKTDFYCSFNFKGKYKMFSR